MFKLSLHQPAPPSGHPSSIIAWVAGWGSGLVQTKAITL